MFSLVENNKIVVPGQILVSLDDNSTIQAGDGTMVRERDNVIVATVWGQVMTSTTSSSDAGPLTIRVVAVDARTPANGTASTSATGAAAVTVAGPVVPRIGDTVTCLVTRLTGRHASVSILCVGDHALPSPFQGIIRRQDIRLTELDSVLVHESFHPTDIVVARILSLGDRKSFFLTTAANELGVVFARCSCQPNHVLVPVAWNKMLCPVTKKLEPRKVAKLSIV